MQLPGAWSNWLEEQQLLAKEKKKPDVSTPVFTSTDGHPKRLLCVYPLSLFPTRIFHNVSHRLKYSLQGLKDLHRLYILSGFPGAYQVAKLKTLTS